ncbi:MAG: GMC family oxidoreductase [Dehalococcoidia bacterium]
MAIPSNEPDVLGNTDLDSFDAIVIGSGAGGSTAAYVLATNGKKVLVLESGDNYFEGLDDPDKDKPVPLFSNDELKLRVRDLISPDPLLEPRTFRASEADGERTHVGEVNNLPKTVGGGAVHADMKYPRFQETDFRLGSLLGEVPGASFADWPLTYDELEPFYAEAEQITGVQGDDSADPFASPRSKGYPMPPGAPMYVSLLAAEGARKQGYQPFPYPTAINSRPYRGRPPCVDCGFCSGYGCPTNAKGSPAVTFLREALLSENCQVRYNCHVARLLANASKTSIEGVEYIDPDGNRRQAKADIYVLGASAIESARLCLLSDPDGAGLGNSSGLVGRNLMFHFQTVGVGIFQQRLHGHRGRALTHGMADFRGVPGDPERPLAGIIEFGASTELIFEAKTYATTLGMRGERLKEFLRQSPLRDRLMGLTMQAEDAPQPTNRVDLDPEVRDVYGLPVARITYQNHAFELSAREFYMPKLLAIVQAAGAQFGFIAPPDTPPASRHIMGTLRMSDDARSSVCDGFGKFHDLENLYCADGATFVTSSGYNPTLTIHALALRMAGNLISPSNAARVLRHT